MAQSPLNGLSEAERALAFERFELLRLALEEGVPLARVARDRGIALRTAQRWAGQYRRDGLAGLVRKGRSDQGKRHLSDTLRQAIEGLALKKPPLSAASIHRQAVILAERLGEPPPTYRIVYAVIRDLDPALVTLAHEGTKAYSEAFDLIHRHEATGPNAIWQADHTELDIVLKDGRGRPEKPWLTVILDDYSRAVAGYALFFGSPSAIQTALALRQAIWRKGRPGWQVCGIPGILYSDHGSDFTSHHLEQVAADLKIRLINSMAGRPRGRGKIERFFESVSQVLLPRLPGYAPAGASSNAGLTLAGLAAELERFLVDEYHNEPHTTTGFKPQERWVSGGFLPRMPESLEQLDLLLLTVPKTRRVHPDGIRFSGLRYIDPTLAAYGRLRGGGGPAAVRPARHHRGPGLPRGPLRLPGGLPGAGPRDGPAARGHPGPGATASRAAPDDPGSTQGGGFPAGGPSGVRDRGDAGRRPGEPPGASTAGEDAQAVRR